MKKNNEISSKMLSIIYGESLTFEQNTPKNLAQILLKTAINFPNQGIILLSSTNEEYFLSYAVLKNKAEKILAALKKLGAKSQTPILLQFDDNGDFFTTFWGCTLGGLIPVPLAAPPLYNKSNSQTMRMINVWKTLEKPIILTTLNLKPKIGELLTQLDYKDFRIFCCEELITDITTLTHYPSEPNAIALMLPTSGSTGTPKIVQQTHHSLLIQILANITMHNFNNNDVSLNWVPIDHVGSLIMFHLRDVYLGIRQIHAAPNLFLENPIRWLDWIDKYRATITWAPNFAYALVNDCAKIIGNGKWNLSAIRFIFNGGEAVVPKTTRRFLELLLAHQLLAHAMCPAWGMSETCSGTIFYHDFTLENTSDNDQHAIAGKPIPKFAVRIVDENNQIVIQGVSGAIQVTGPQVTIGYYKNPKINAEIFTSDGWFKTGDVGIIVDNQLTITGRNKDLIIINGVNYYSHEIEALVEELGDVEISYTATCAVRQHDNDIDTDHLAIFIAPKKLDNDFITACIKKIFKTIGKKVGINPYFVVPLNKQDIPKTSIGKLQRSVLRKQFMAGKFDTIIQKYKIASFANSVDFKQEALQTELEKNIAILWAEVFKLPSIKVNLNFFTIGGNSLKGMQLLSKINNKFKVNLSMQNFLETEPTIINMAMLIKNFADNPQNDPFLINIEQF